MSWKLAAPSGAENENGRKSVGVLHIRINTDSREPWLGTSPLLSAGISADLLARLESKTADELRAPVGHLFASAKRYDAGETGLTYRTDLASLKGDTALVETQADAHGMGRQAAPYQDWQIKRIGAMIPESHIALREQVGRDVCARPGHTAPRPTLAVTAVVQGKHTVNF